MNAHSCLTDLFVYICSNLQSMAVKRSFGTMSLCSTRRASVCSVSKYNKCLLINKIPTLFVLLECPNGMYGDFCLSTCTENKAQRDNLGLFSITEQIISRAILSPFHYHASGPARWVSIAVIFHKDLVYWHILLIHAYRAGLQSVKTICCNFAIIL